MFHGGSFSSSMTTRTTQWSGREPSTLVIEHHYGEDIVSKLLRIDFAVPVPLQSPAAAVAVAAADVDNNSNNSNDGENQNETVENNDDIAETESEIEIETETETETETDDTHKNDALVESIKAVFGHSESSASVTTIPDHILGWCTNVEDVFLRIQHFLDATPEEREAEIRYGASLPPAIRALHRTNIALLREQHAILKASTERSARYAHARAQAHAASQAQAAFAATAHAHPNNATITPRAPPNTPQAVAATNTPPPAVTNMPPPAPATNTPLAATNMPMPMQHAQQPPYAYGRSNQQQQQYAPLAATNMPMQHAQQQPYAYVRTNHQQQYMPPVNAPNTPMQQAQKPPYPYALTNQQHQYMHAHYNHYWQNRRNLLNMWSELQYKQQLLQQYDQQLQQQQQQQQTGDSNSDSENNSDSDIDSVISDPVHEDPDWKPNAALRSQTKRSSERPSTRSATTTATAAAAITPPTAEDETATAKGQRSTRYATRRLWDKDKTKTKTSEKTAAKAKAKTKTTTTKKTTKSSPDRKPRSHGNAIVATLSPPDDDLGMGDDRGWPEGWTKIGRQRGRGKTSGRLDYYWISPLRKYPFRSLSEVRRFLLALEVSDGDEATAKTQMGFFQQQEVLLRKRHRERVSGKSTVRTRQNGGATATATATATPVPIAPRVAPAAVAPAAAVVGDS